MIHAEMWTMRNGKQIPVCQMTTSHVQNALRGLQQAGYVSPGAAAYYASCPEPHGDGALDAFDAECDYVLNAPTSRFIDIFEDELKQRTEVASCHS